MNSKKVFSSVSNLAIKVLIVLVIVAVGTNLFITMNQALKDAGYPGTMSMLFDYSKYAAGHPARLTGQVISNTVAYAFMFCAVLLFILSLVLIKHDRGVKAKCAVLALFVFVPATLGLTGGIVNFVGEGIQTLLGFGGPTAAGMLGLVLATFALDVAYLVLATITLIVGLRTAVKINNGEAVDEEEQPCCCGEHKETLEEKAAREEKEAAERVKLLEDIRRIVREELDKLDRIVIAKEAPVVRVKSEPKPEPKPEPVPEVEEKRSVAQRIPFAKKVVKADKEIQEKYNEIKNEILAYGAKSRVSIAGDTFRIHRKPYVKITLIGKTLKIYFALDPKDYEESPIPVSDSSDKASYEEVPALLKVRSDLSVKRAKMLVADAMAKDGIKKEAEPEEHNWVKDLRAELKAKK